MKKIHISWEYPDNKFSSIRNNSIVNIQYMKWVTRLGYKHSYDNGDMLLLIGGADIGTNPFRDKHESDLVTKYLEQGKPIFGICRGMQLLGLRYGCNFLSHIPDITNKINHLSDTGNHKGNSSWHKIKDENGKSYIVNSRHHQGFMKSNDYNIFCQEYLWSEDGIVEGIRGRDYQTNFSSVQFHPEREEVWDTDSETIAKREIYQLLK